MIVREKDDSDLYDAVQRQNLFRQYGLLDDSIGIGLKKGIESFDKYTLWALNHAAVADRAWESGHYDLDDLADYLQDLLERQLQEL